MKKLIRLFIAIFCVFFALRAMPGSFLPIFRSFARNAAEMASDATLLLAEKIDDELGSGEEEDTPDSKDPGEEQSAEGAGGHEQTQAGSASLDHSTDGSEQESGSPEKKDSDKNDSDKGDSNKADSDKADSNQSDSDKSDSDKNDSDKTDSGKNDSGKDTDNSSPSGNASAEGTEEGDAQGTDSGETAAEKQNPPGKSRRVQSEADISYYYYTRISREERLLYDAMLALARDPESGQSATESRLLSLNPSSEAFAESYTRAYNALMSDHPELFWIAQGRVRYECKYYLLPSFGGNYKILLSLADASGNESFLQYREEMDRLESAAEALLDQVDFSCSDAEISLQIHDLLINNAWYNIQAGSDDYAHTAYGALVEDSLGNPGGALCDGYALAYEYLLQRAGLTSTMVCGYAGASEEDTEKHAWNLVQLDDDWYEVDPTWDDLDFLLSPSDDGYDLLLEALSDAEYMAAIRHYMFNRTTEQMRSFTPGEEYRYVSYNGWVTLLQPSVHIRFAADESEETRDYVTPLAPVAEGTWYTWGMLTGSE